MTASGRGISRLLNGVIKYRKLDRKNMVDRFDAIKKHAEDNMPSALIISCADSRILSSKFTQSNVGETFYIRNAGNMVPRETDAASAMGCPEPAVLELACFMNKVRDVVICGHSDCKAMNCLHSFQSETLDVLKLEQSQLKKWLYFHGSKSLQRFDQLNSKDWTEPLTFLSDSYLKPFKAFIDAKSFVPSDRLSQINTLQQLENVTSYRFMKEPLESGQVQLHAMWFNLSDGNVYYFSKTKEQFVTIDEGSIDELSAEAMS